MYVRNKMNRSRDCGFDPCNRPQYFLLRGHTGPRGCPGMPGMPGSHGGPPGPTGAAGASSKIVVGATDPLVPPPPGQNIYVNPVGGNVYSSLAGVWTLIGNIKGHTGQRGKEGITGARGKEGVTGKRGKEGSTGARGKEGSTGAKGKQGDPGQGDRKSTYELASNVTSFGPNIRSE